MYRALLQSNIMNYPDLQEEKLSHSIENVISGDSFPTEISSLTKNDLKQITKKNGWNFNWAIEYQNQTKDVYKLTIIQNPTNIQGLVRATHIGGHKMIIFPENAQFLINKYFKKE